jgi:hypothetical protein
MRLGTKAIAQCADCNAWIAKAEVIAKQAYPMPIEPHSRPLDTLFPIHATFNQSDFV